MFELVKKIAGVRRLFSAVVAAATLATVTSLGGVAGAAATPIFNAPPSAPINVMATSANASVVLSWTTPYYTGGTAQWFGYNIYMGTAAGGESTTALNGQVPIYGNNGPGQTTTFTVPNLTNGTKYYFTVSAVNVLGMSGLSSEVSAVPAGPPGAPTAVTAVATSGQVVLSWTAPTSTGGSPILGYNVYCTNVVANAGCYSDTFSADSFSTASPTYPINGPTPVATTTYTLKGLSNGSSYQFDVTAVNAIGEGPIGTSNAVTPLGVPNQPEYGYVGGKSTDGTQMTMCVYPPTFIGGGPSTSWFTTGGSPILGYNFYIGTTPGGESASPANGASTPVTAASPTCYTFTGLIPGAVYYMKSAAVTAAGVGAMSQEVEGQTHTTVPTAPQTVTATAVDGPTGAMTVSWTAPALNGGRAITAYHVLSCDNAVPTCTPGSAVSAGLNTSYTFTGLTFGDPYLFVVYATNFNGNGASSAAVTATVANTVPSAPTITHVLSSATTTASVCWTASTLTGNGTIIGYNIYEGTTAGGESATPLNNTPFPSPTCQTVVGLTPGTTYYFTVKAVNAIGTSAASAEISVVAGGTVPGAPGAVSFTGGANNTGTMVSAWTAPSNGGDTVGFGVANSYQLCASATSGSEFSVPAGFCWTFSTNTNTFNPNLLFLTGSTVYVAVRALNSFGYGAWSTESSYVVPSTPSTPGGLTVTNYAGNSTNPYTGYVNLSWSASVGVGTGFTPVTYAVVEVTGPSASCTVGYTTSTNFTVIGWQYDQTGITNGGNCNSEPVLNNGATSTFEVYAMNAMGTSPMTAPVAVLSGQLPDRAHDSTWGVQSVSATTALVTFNYLASSAMGRDGYSFYGPSFVGVTKYVATAWVGSTPWSTCTFTVGSPSNPIADGCMLTGLPNNTHFTVTLQMVNALGTGYIDTDGFVAGPGVDDGNPFTLENFATLGAAPVLTVTSVDTTHVLLDVHDPSAFRNNGELNYLAYANLNAAVDYTTGGVGGSPACSGIVVTPALGKWSVDGTGGYQCEYLLTNLTGWTAGAPVSFGAYSVDYWNNGLSPESNQVRITAVAVVPAAPVLDFYYSGDPNWQSFGNNGGFTTYDPYVCWDTATGATGYNVYLGTTAGGESTTPVNGVIPQPEGLNSNCMDLYYLTAGTTYYIVVKAVNAVGTSVASNEVSITPPLVPTAPLNVVGTGGDHSVVLSWNPPSSLGTSPFMGYYVYAGSSPNGENSYPVNASPVAGTTYTVTGLTNGVPYYFFVVAANAAGLSPAAFGEEVSVTPQSKAATNTKLILSAKTAKLGHENTVHVHISVTGAAVSGNVTVKWTNRVICRAVLVNGNASCVAAKNGINKLGTRTMTVTYAGDANTLGSVGKALIKITK